MKVIIPPKGQAVTYEKRLELIECAKSCIGIPWQHLGRNRYGLDCAGLLILVVHEVLGVWVEISDYSPWPSPNVMREMCNKALIRKHGEIILGDIVLCYAPGYGVIHLGWHTGNSMIHASNEIGEKKVIETSIQSDWRIRGIYEVPQYG